MTETGSTLFALEVTVPEHAPRVLLNPGHFAILDVHRYSVIAFVIARNKASADLSFACLDVHEEPSCSPCQVRHA